ncbi:hypothetical protein [Streptomyces phaeochromogenes]
MAMNVIGLIGWIATWFGLLYVLIVYLSQGFVFLFVLPLCYCVYRVLVQLRYFPTAFRMVRALRAYPWQVLPGVPRGLDENPEAEDAGIWVEIPNPTGRAKGIPLVFVKHHRAYWWMRRIGGPRTKPMLKAQLEPLWFAGDPRFLGVLAAPAKGGDAPRRLHFLYQPSALSKTVHRREWEDASPADLERARHAGALVLSTVQRSR